MLYMTLVVKAIIDCPKHQLW